jgi:hypothetical protein
MASRRVAVRLALMVLAALLAVHGASGVVEGWRLAPLDAFVHAVWWGGTPPALPARIADWQPQLDNGRAWAAYGQAALAVLDSSESSRHAGGEAAIADAAIQRALTLAPAQPASWVRFALLRLNQVDRDGAREALSLSLRTGPAQRGIAWLRCRLGLYLWDDLGHADRVAVATDIARFWWQKPTAAMPYPQFALIRFARGIGRLDTVREALPNSERALLEERLQTVIKEVAGAG